MLQRVIVKTILAILVYGGCLFGGAGTLRWPSAWIFLLIMFSMGAITMALLWRTSPELVEERMRGAFQREQVTWDKVFLAMLMPAYLGWLALMGVDAIRFTWTDMPIVLQILGGAALIALSLWMYRVLRANAFAAPVVKIDEKRGQTVATTGPYALMRHPMYAGMLVMFPSIALLLGSAYGLVGAAVLNLFVVVRATLEDRLLRRELDGYEAYADRVRYRLIPGIW